MTYAELLTLQATYEASLTSLAAGKSVTIDGRELTYEDIGEVRRQLSQINRDIVLYKRRVAGQSNPGVRTPKWA